MSRDGGGGGGGFDKRFVKPDPFVKPEPAKVDDPIRLPDMTGPNKGTEISVKTPRPKDAERKFPFDPNERAPGIERDPSLYVPIVESKILIHHDVKIDNRELMDMILQDDKMLDTYFGSQGSVFGIEPDKFEAFLKESSEGNRTDYAIIDLRWTDEDYKTTPEDERRQFKGAVHFPLTMSSTAPDYVLKYTSLNSVKAEDTSRQLWEKVMADNSQPISGLGAKNYLFFHCAQSTNRTPVAASGFVKFVLPTLTHKPTVVILEGGFEQYKEVFGMNDPNLEQWTG